jgi:hypothetical protein
MRALSILAVFFGVPWVASDAAAPPPIEIPITITQGTSVRVPFSVTWSGTYDLELQYRAGVETDYNRSLDRKLVRELGGTVTLSSDGRILKRNCRPDRAEHFLGGWPQLSFGSERRRRRHTFVHCELLIFPLVYLIMPS